MLSASLSRIKISLRWILLIPFVLQTLGAVGLVGYLSYRSGEQAVENLANQLVGEVRKQLELALQASQAKLNDILNSASASITSMQVYKDGSWDINHVSAGCEVISGYTAEELRNDQYLWVSRIVPEDSESMTSVLFDNIFAGRAATYEYQSTIFSI